MTEHREPYHLLGLISMTPTLWVFLFAQLVLLAVAIALCFVRTSLSTTSNKLVLGNTVALVLSVVVSVLTVLAGFLESFAAQGPASEKAAQLASGILTVMNGLLMAIPIAIAFAVALGIQLTRRQKLAAGPSTRHPS